MNHVAVKLAPEEWRILVAILTGARRAMVEMGELDHDWWTGTVIDRIERQTGIDMTDPKTDRAKAVTQ